MVNSTSKSADFSKTWLVEVLRKLSSSSMTCESLETHQLDILVSRQWLQMLLWQLSVKQGLLTTSSTEEPFNLQYPILLARDVVKTISSVNQESLDCHGIGMVSSLKSSPKKTMHLTGVTGTKASRYSCLFNRRSKMR